MKVTTYTCIVRVTCRNSNGILRGQMAGKIRSNRPKLTRRSARPSRLTVGENPTTLFPCEAVRSYIAKSRTRTVGILRTDVSRYNGHLPIFFNAVRVILLNDSSRFVNLHLRTRYANFIVRENDAEHVRFANVGW